ncbi:MAG: methyltransferase domain-containing protein [Pseudomonadota bacterium]
MTSDRDSCSMQRQQLNEWFDSPLGRSLQAHEAYHLRAVLPNLYGTVAAQLGRIGDLDLMDACIAPTRILLDDQAGPGNCRVRSIPEELPLDTKSADVMILPHTLDFCDEPHQVLREVSRVLRPEGHVVILGFNPVSLWGFRRLFTRRPRPAPWCGKFFRLARIKDWLGLLDFETTHGMMLYYRPPLRNEGFMHRLHFLDRMGDRWWPMMAGVYLVVAKKRVVGVTPLPVSWKTKRAVASGAAQPAARGMILPFRKQ